MVAKETIVKLRGALEAITRIAGNLPDDRLTDKTGPNDAKQRGLMVVRARDIAVKALSEEPELSDEGVELSDGGLIEYPDDDGSIRRRDIHGDTMDVKRPGDEGYDGWYSLFDLDMAGFNRRWERNNCQDALNLQMKRKELWDNDAEFQAAQAQCETVRSEMIDELIKSNQSWRVTDEIIYFMHPTDNYEMDTKGSQRFPYVVWDSESGQGFVYLNNQFADEVMKWLESKGCEDVSVKDSASKGYLSDPEIHHPDRPLTV